MTDDHLADAYSRLADSLAPPIDTVARVTARVERRRRRRTTSLAAASVVAVVAGVGVAGSLPGGAGTAGPAPLVPAAAATPSAGSSALPPIEISCGAHPRCGAPRDLEDLTLTYDASRGVLVPLRGRMPTSLPRLPARPGPVGASSSSAGVSCIGPHRQRSFVEALTGGSPTRTGAIADQRRPGESAYFLHVTGTTYARLGRPARPRIQLELLHGFEGWVWLQRTTCTAAPTPR